MHETIDHFRLNTHTSNDAISNNETATLKLAVLNDDGTDRNKAATAKLAFAMALEQNNTDNNSQTSSSNSGGVEESDDTPKGEMKPADKETYENYGSNQSKIPNNNIGGEDLLCMKTAAKDNKICNDSAVTQVANDNICDDDLSRLNVNVSDLKDNMHCEFYLIRHPYTKDTKECQQLEDINEIILKGNS